MDKVSESYVKKRFKKDGFSIIKLDTHSLYKSPDYKATKGNFSIILEVKVGFKKGTILKRLSNNAFQFDPFTAVEDYFSNASTKLKEHITHNPSDKYLPYILIFTSPFFIVDELHFSKSLYKKYQNISAIFIPKRTHPLDSKAKDMPMEELENLINSKSVPFVSQTSLGWNIIKNPYATHALDTRNFPSAGNISYP